MSEARQRWRLIVARGEAARNLPQRDVTVAWEAAFRASGLPLAETDAATPRLRVAYGAPVPVGMFAEREPIDVALYERHRIHEVRAAIERVVPAGHRLVDLYDVWPAAPTLAASILAGDYRATCSPGVGDAPSLGALEAAAAAVVAAPRIVSRREKSGSVVEVDIRPHILDLRVEGARTGAGSDVGAGGVEGAPFDLVMRLRLGGEGGVGRPEEVVAAFAERLGRSLVSSRLTRERVILTDGPA
jgi:radical SAM-linked protein